MREQANRKQNNKRSNNNSSSPVKISFTAEDNNSSDDESIGQTRERKRDTISNVLYEPVTCHNCEATFETSSDYFNHDCKEVNNLKCPTCKYTFTSKKRYNNHTKKACLIIQKKHANLNYNKDS